MSYVGSAGRGIDNVKGHKGVASWEQRCLRQHIIAANRANNRVPTVAMGKDIPMDHVLLGSEFKLGIGGTVQHSKQASKS
jgi:hypothetical protein